VSRLTLQITKFKGAQEKFRDIQATLTQQEASLTKLTRERDRLKEKNKTLTERCATMADISKDLRDQQARNATYITLSSHSSIPT
jgi:cell division protein FtsB